MVIAKMNRFGCFVFNHSRQFSPNTRSISSTNVVYSYAKQHRPNEKPESVDTASNKQDWMKVRWKGHDTIEYKIWKTSTDETLRSDPEEARQISDEKLNSLSKSLMSRGYCREAKPYDPPNDVENHIALVYEEVYGKKAPENLLEMPLTDHVFKFKFLTLCSSRFNHEVVSSDLHRIKVIGDVVRYYLCPVRGVNSYDQLVRTQDDLPPNLFVIPEVKRYNPNDKDNFFKGIDSYPGVAQKVKGLRAQNKYEIYKPDKHWPDI